MFAYQPQRISPPGALVVSVAEAKAHLRVEDETEDAVIQSYIEAATAHFDGWSGILGRALVAQGWRQTFDRFCEPLRLPMMALSITAVKVAGVAVDAEVYELLHDDLGSFLRRKSGKSWPAVPSGRAQVAVEFVAGYGAAATDVPLPIRTAILLMTAHLYENRGGTNQGGPPPILDILVRPHRRVGL